MLQNRGDLRVTAVKYSTYSYFRKENKSLVKKLIFFSSYVKMGKEFLKFGEVEIEKQEFHSSKSTITINNIHSPQKVANTI